MRYLCIHGHFYQPPRENPWLEAIEVQDSAYPYHDWNERITAESYAPNAASRILDVENRIVRIINNYSKISFNFGPTLLSWAKDKAPELYRDILAADRDSIQLYGGHGSAIAQCYNHSIMPLSNSRDKETQVIWGIADFRHRFQREPEGMWLPETAVDLESLDLLAEHGIKYTILAPSQAKSFRRIGEQTWHDVSGARIDPKRPYLCRLPSGRSIALFFYDGPISRAVAFEGLLRNGEIFAQRLLTAFGDPHDGDQLAHIATDGETYGHHHHYGEMALAYAIHHLESHDLARITNYGEYLELHPPEYEAEIFENTAWSCAHGVGRWSRDCGCNAGGPGWNQAWRGPLREALDWLRDTVCPLFEHKAAKYLKDPWAARNDYVQVILDRSPEVRRAFLEKHALGKLTAGEQVICWKLLEMQRNAMLMYTSCGWFFSELSGIETVQVIQYAGRVVQLAEQVFGELFETPFLERLALAKSNLPEYRDGALIYEKQVKPTVIDLRTVAAHYGISSLFENYQERSRIYCYFVEREVYQTENAGKLRFAIGRARLTSAVTQESDVLTFGVLHFGDHNITGGVREFRDEERFRELVQKSSEAFERANISEVIRQFDRGFGINTYSLNSLFQDEQRRVLERILGTTFDEAQSVFGQFYENHAPLMRFLSELRTPTPRPLQFAAEYALNSKLRRALGATELDIGQVRALLDEACRAKVELDATTLEFTYRKRIERMAEAFAGNPDDFPLLRRLREALGLLKPLPFPVTLWSVQNIWHELSRSALPNHMKQSSLGNDAAAAWVEEFQRVAEKLKLQLG